MIVPARTAYRAGASGGDVHLPAETAGCPNPLRDASRPPGMGSSRAGPSPSSSVPTHDRVLGNDRRPR